MCHKFDHSIPQGDLQGIELLSILRSNLPSTTMGGDSDWAHPPLGRKKKKGKVPTPTVDDISDTESLPNMSNKALLSKMDKLRELSAGALIPLPQVHIQPLIREPWLIPNRVLVVSRGGSELWQEFSAGKLIGLLFSEVCWSDH